MSDTQGAQLDPSMNVGLTGGNFLNPAYATPSQRAQLYAYANELMKPQPVKTGWQGLAEIARALVGGYEGHQADIQEQASRANDYQTNLGVAPAYSPSGASPAGPSPAGPSGAPSSLPAGTSDYAEPASPSADTSHLNPAFADRVQDLQQDAEMAGIPSKLISGYRSPAEQADLYKKYLAGGNLAAPPGKSLHNAGLAADIVANDPSKQSALVAMARDPARGLTPGANFGDPDHFQMAGPAPPGSASAFAPSSGPPAGPAPAVQAIGAALAQGRPIQTAQNGPGGMPVSQQAIAAFLSNPNIDPSLKHQAMEVLAPKMYQDATGRVLPSFQNQPVAPPIANLGVRSDINAANPSLPLITSGSPGAPTAALAIPGAAPGASPPSGGGLGKSIIGPGSPLGDLQSQAQANAAQGNVTNAKAAANQARFQQTQEQGPALQAAAYPLHQLQAVLDKNGGVVPTGHGADDVMNVASIGNMIGTLLGHPLTGEDSSLTSFELMRKYGTQVAMSITGHPTDLGLQAAEATSPGASLSPQANMHLVDNYVRLNALAQKKAQFEHDYYLSHGQGPNAYDNFNTDWTKEISGPNAVPLSKFGRDVKLKDGTDAVYVPSTDPSGFSVFRKDDPHFKPSVMTPGVNP